MPGFLLPLFLGCAQLVAGDENPTAPTQGVELRVSRRHGSVSRDVTSASLVGLESKSYRCWKHALYMNGQNDLESASVEDLKELLQNNDARKLVAEKLYDVRVIMDRAVSYNNTEVPDLGKPSRGEVVVGRLSIRNGKSVLAKESWPYKKKKLLSTEMMEKFLKYALPTDSGCYEFAEFWNHGMGSFGYGSDLSHHHMHVSAIGKAISKAFDWRKRKKIDILGFDACYMSSFEVAYVVHRYAKYMIGSEETEPNGGWDYRDFAIASRLKRANDPLALGKDIVDDFVRHHTEAPITLSLIDLEAFGDLASMFDKIVARITEGLKKGDLKFYTVLARARQASATFASSVNASAGSGESARSHVDIGDILTALAKDDRFDGLATKAKRLYDMKIYVKRGLGKATSPAASGYSGMSIFFPSFGSPKDPKSQKLAKLKMNAYKKGGNHAPWSNLLDAYLAFRPVRRSSKLSITLESPEEEQAAEEGKKKKKKKKKWKKSKKGKGVSGQVAAKAEPKSSLPPPPVEAEIKMNEGIEFNLNPFIGFEGTVSNEVSEMTVHIGDAVDLDGSGKHDQDAIHVYVSTSPHLHTERKVGENAIGWSTDVLALYYQWGNKWGPLLSVDDGSGADTEDTDPAKRLSKKELNALVRFIRIPVEFFDDPYCGRNLAKEDLIGGVIPRRYGYLSSFVKRDGSLYDIGTPKEIADYEKKLEADNRSGAKDKVAKHSEWSLNVAGRFFEGKYIADGISRMDYATNAPNGSIKFRQHIMHGDCTRKVRSKDSCSSKYLSTFGCYRWDAEAAATKLNLYRQGSFSAIVNDQKFDETGVLSNTYTLKNFFVKLSEKTRLRLSQA